eukprot:TRINITY_DN15049_c0_g1_i1.p1 TRINITY_DN15049_c0_g1~~TRINITY_DN15049_c0_g1_i1.p1  ORF type:complete len:294 (+),score=50.42 TRINITY_DN15049_c0_g1_i1:31-912(+)
MIATKATDRHPHPVLRADPLPDVADPTGSKKAREPLKAPHFGGTRYLPGHVRPTPLRKSVVPTMVEKPLRHPSPPESPTHKFAHQATSVPGPEIIFVRPRSLSADTVNKMQSRLKVAPFSAADLKGSADIAARRLEESDKLVGIGIAKLIRSWLEDAPKPDPKDTSIFAGGPTCSLDEFVQALVRTLRLFGLTHTWALLMLVYVRRLVLRDTIVVSWSNIYRLILAATLTAIKFHTDEVISNRDFANAVGMSKSELCVMEIEYLTIMRFDLQTTEAEYHQLCIDVCAAADEND